MDERWWCVYLRRFRYILTLFTANSGGVQAGSFSCSTKRFCVVAREFQTTKLELGFTVYGTTVLLKDVSKMRGVVEPCHRKRFRSKPPTTECQKNGDRCVQHWTTTKQDEGKAFPVEAANRRVCGVETVYFELSRKKNSPKESKKL